MKKSLMICALFLALALLFTAGMSLYAEESEAGKQENAESETEAAEDEEKAEDASEEKAEDTPEEAEEAEEYDYAAETQIHQFRSHGGDREELTVTLEALFQDLKDGKDGSDYIAAGSKNRDKIMAYFETLKGLESMEELSVVNDLFYQVKEKPTFQNFRSISAFTYIVPGENGEKWMYTDRLAMAKLGPEEHDWKIWDVLFTANPINVGDVDLIQLDPPEEGEEICVIETTAGDIKCRLFPEAAPKAIENFKGLAAQGFYDGKLFHRVIPEFVIQGGAENDTPEEGLSFFGEPFEDEFADNLFNFNGALSLANSGPDSNGNQFFIVQNTKVREEDLKLTSLPENAEEKYKEIGGMPHLDFRHVVFGQVFEGMDVVVKIANQETDDEARPLKDPVTMVTIRFEPYKK